ncbi:MAG: hypothetical protein VZT48_08630 [Bulleidia sp.]|nr:hypothetical protein [Bulleidia sp.]
MDAVNAYRDNENVIGRVITSEYMAIAVTISCVFVLLDILYIRRMAPLFEGQCYNGQATQGGNGNE